jgi:hypothetical protein
LVVAALNAVSQEDPMKLADSHRMLSSATDTAAAGRTAPYKKPLRGPTSKKSRRGKAKPIGKAATPRHKPTAGGPSKQNRVIALLSRRQGTTIGAIMKVTDWQQHSVRGFFAGVVRKKLGLKLVSESGPGGRVYRIIGAARASKAG